jgi:hypothetical protein
MNALLGFMPANVAGCPIFARFREMWDGTGLPLSLLAPRSSVRVPHIRTSVRGPKRWANVNHSFSFRMYRSFIRTGAKRSGATCGSFPVPLRLQLCGIAHARQHPAHVGETACHPGHRVVAVNFVFQIDEALVLHGN